MKHTYEIKKRDGNILVVAYTSSYAELPVIEKELFIPDGGREVVFIAEAIPFSQWSREHPELFPPKPPGTPSEFKVDPTKQPPKEQP
jgi:hypothetical protein